jgi:hypothetical protein
MLSINIPHVDRPAARANAIICDRRLFLAADEATVVEADDEGARFLLASAGGSIPGPEVERLELSIVDGRVVQRAAALPEAVAPAEPEKVEAPSEPEKVEVPAESSDAKPAAGGKREKK